MEINRIGNFTSSQIFRLMTLARNGKDFGAPAISYIEEKKMELRLGRQLNSEHDAKATSWGKLVEKRAFDLIGLDYDLRSQERLVHPTIPHWTGAPDCIKGDAVADIKCPWTLKSFCELIDGDYGDNHNIYFQEIKDEFPEYYWQLISNSILTNKPNIELIVYCPYKNELPIIREMASNFDGGGQYKYAFINWADDDNLPYLIEGGYYKNLNIFRSEAPESDKKLLTDTVIKAVSYLKI